MKYTVEVTREGDAWIADVVDLAGAHTFARSLTALYRAVEEVIALVAAVPDGTDVSEIDYEFVGIDADLADAVRIGNDRTAADALTRRLAAEAAERIALLTRRYLSRYHRDHPEEGCPMPPLAARL